MKWKGVWVITILVSFFFVFWITERIQENNVSLSMEKSEVTGNPNSSQAELPKGMKAFFTNETQVHIGKLEVLKNKRMSVVEDYDKHIPAQNVEAEDLEFLKDKILPAYKEIIEEVIIIVDYYNVIEVRNLGINFNPRVKSLYTKYYEGASQEYQAMVNVLQGYERGNKNQIEKSQEQFDLADTTFQEFGEMMRK
ncbi:hypothetical protein [Halobacillus yeomjeoni]|uniref:Uncharacterized protein n=1 Tax=Halobacillus yeomjeoni TaxID=311194 RepID=A0A931HTD9_9BACI|nr:hypothetical protein [Halobacillus yeomjeoni]MBH0229209.1 hypothetical protein [Halobacillus yeomjeoni]